MTSGQPSRSQPTIATKRPRGRSPLRALLRFVALLVFLIAAAYLAHAAWNGVQYFQRPVGFKDYGLIPSMVALPALGLSVDTELIIGLVMLVLFIGSLTLLLATRSRRELMTGPLVAPSAMPPVPASPETSVGDATTPNAHHSLPLLPHMLIPTLPPEEAALLVPPAESSTADAPDGSPEGRP